MATPGGGDEANVEHPQALIVARDTDDPTARFVWSDVLGSEKILRDWIDIVYRQTGTAKYFAHLRRRLQWNVDLLRALIKASAFEDSDSSRAKADLFYTEASWFAKPSIRLIQRNRPFTSLLLKLALPRYDAILKQREEQAASFCKEHSEVGLFLP